MGPKAICCLHIAASPESHQRKAAYGLACALYGQKAVDKKLENLAKKGYIEYGVSARTGWLTDKGREVLHLTLLPTPPVEEP